MGVAVDFMSTDNLNHHQICKSYLMIRVINELLVLTFQKFTIICIIVALLFTVILSHHLIIPEDLKLYLSPVHKEVLVASQIQTQVANYSFISFLFLK